MPKPNQFYFDLAKSGDYDALVEAITNQQFNPLAMSPHGTTVWHYLAEGVHYDKLVQAPLMSLHVLHNFAEFILDNIRIDNYE